MINDIARVSVSEKEIDEMLNRLGKKITEDYKDRDPMIIGLLKGCNPFMSDLVKKINIPLTLGYMKCSSYRGTESTGIINIDGTLPNVKDRDVIVVDDILDTGRTLEAVIKLLKGNGAKSVSLCVLLDKPEGRKVPVYADYVGGLVPNEFVVGYGLDYNEHYRNLPFIGVLKPEIYSK